MPSCKYVLASPISPRKKYGTITAIRKYASPTQISGRMPAVMHRGLTVVQHRAVGSPS